MNPPVYLSVPARSSAGLLVLAEQVRGGLAAAGRCVRFRSGQEHGRSMPLAVESGVVNVSFGNRVLSLPGAREVLWPLNVAPAAALSLQLDVLGGASLARNLLRAALLRREATRAAGAIFSSRCAQRGLSFAFSHDTPQLALTGPLSMPAVAADAEADAATPRTLMTTGHLYRYKGVLELIRGFGQSTLRDDWRLLIVGSLADRAYGKQIKRALKAAPAGVELVGPMERPAVLQALTHTSAFVLPSRLENAAAFGLQEALAAGLPIAAADLEVNRELCGSAALTFKPGDAEDIARVLSLLGAGEVRDQLRKAALRRRATLSDTVVPEQFRSLDRFLSSIGRRSYNRPRGAPG